MLLNARDVGSAHEKNSGSSCTSAVCKRRNWIVPQAQMFCSYQHLKERIYGVNIWNVYTLIYGWSISMKSMSTSAIGVNQKVSWSWSSTL